MQHQSLKTRRTGRSAQGRIPPHRYHRDGATLLLALSLLLSLVLSVLGQEQTTPAHRTEIIVIGKPLTQPLQYHFNGQSPPAQTVLEFNDNSNDWRFILFDQLPAHTALIVKGAPAGYENAEQLQPERWYPFKGALPLILEITPEAYPPVEIGFWFGSPNAESDKALLPTLDRKSTRLNSSHSQISYAVFCL